MLTGHRQHKILLKSFVLLACISATYSFIHAAYGQPPKQIGFREISDDLEAVTSIIHDPRNIGHLLIAERVGLVLSVDTSNGKTKEIVDISDLIGKYSPRGLLDIAAQSTGSTQNLFLSYIDSQGDLVVGRFTLSNSEATLDETSMAVVIKIARLSLNVLGASLDLSPDGLLYIGMNDGEGINTARAQTAQQSTTLLGKIIRISPGVRLGYSIPSDNPFRAQADFLPEIWALGFRSPEALQFSAGYTTPFVLDSSERHNEINRVEPGKNYGWNSEEASECLVKDCSKSSFMRPILSFPKPSTKSRLVGGFVHNGKRYPDLRQSLLFAETTSGTIYAAKESSSKTWDHHSLGRIPKGEITAMGEDLQGRIYISSDTGQLLELIP
ncbi:MAG: PQQ-dependent sugar dehydrogenase [Pseudomonadota bacterium]|jgi:glucose/arabinose dehydrogenase